MTIKSKGFLFGLASLQYPLEISFAIICDSWWLFFVILRFEEYFFTVCNSSLLRVTPESQEICDALMKPILYEKYLPFTNTLRTITGLLLPEPIALQYGFDVGTL